MNAVQRAKVAEEIVRKLAAALRGAQLYAAAHPIVTRNVAALADTLTLAHAGTQSLTIGIVGDELVVGDTPVPRAAGWCRCTPTSSTRSAASASIAMRRGR